MPDLAAEAEAVGIAPAMVPLRLHEASLALPGFAHGLRSPSIVARITGCVVAPGLVAAAVRSLLDALLPPEPALPPESAEDMPSALLAGVRRLQWAAGLRMLERGRVVVSDGGGTVVCVPTLADGHRAAHGALRWIVDLAGAQDRGDGCDLLAGSLPKILAALANIVPGGRNTAHFMRAAVELGLPVQQLPGSVVQYGHGARARWLVSSFTDETPQLAASLARSKTATAAMLRRAGVPVPDHRPARDVAAALRIAASLGYPVVVKPADLDGGVGVAADLRTPDEVRSAFAAARRHSQAILVEKHFEGRDYRLNVFRGELLWAIERTPGGVTGDGTLGVAALVERLNADPRRGTGPRSPLKRLELDDEADGLLAQAGLTRASVPAAGRFVALRRVANVSSGGTPVAVMDRVHPDNRRLALRAAAALRLDLAGVDMLIADIGRSWRETGAVVCEVNGQPQLGEITSRHLYGELLRALVDGDGRIPIVVIFGAAPESALAVDVARGLEAAGLRCGLVNRDGVTVAGEKLLDGDVGLFRGGQLLAMHRGIDAAVLCIDDLRLLRSGLPFDRFDLLVIAGSHLAGPGGRAPGVDLVQRALRTLLAACRSRLLLDASHAAAFALSSEGPKIDLFEADAGAETIARLLLEACHRPLAGGTGAARGQRAGGSDAPTG